MRVTIDIDGVPVPAGTTGQATESDGTASAGPIDGGSPSEQLLLAVAAAGGSDAAAPGPGAAVNGSNGVDVVDAGSAPT